MRFTVRLAENWDEVTAALALRTRVFCEEQGVDPAAEIDGCDPEALHVVAVEHEGRVMGTCRLLFDAGVCKLGRMAVAPEARRGGLGLTIMEVAERAARDGGAGEVRLHAQTAARGFYERCGYEALGEAFMEEGIEHVRMRKDL